MGVVLVWHDREKLEVCSCLCVVYVMNKLCCVRVQYNPSYWGYFELVDKFLTLSICLSISLLLFFVLSLVYLQETRYLRRRWRNQGSKYSPINWGTCFVGKTPRSDSEFHFN